MGKMQTAWSKWIAVFTAVVLILSLWVIPAAAEDESGTNIDLYAKAAVLMDASTGRVLFEKNGSEQLPMASTTKIMTCILALEQGNPEDFVKVSGYASGMPKVKLYMREGEYYRLEDLLYSLMLESHNDSAVAIAEHVGGSVEGFAAMMNRKAREIGCTDTYFITPNGLDAATVDGSKVHSTTARDLAAIMSYCLNASPKKEEFLAITRTGSYQFVNYKKGTEQEEYIKGGRSFSMVNHNAFLQMMEGALSGKTGFTNNAGYCYVGALERDGRRFVVALLGCGWPNHKNYKWSDTRELMEYGLDNYSYRDIFRLPDLDSVVVREGVPVSQKPYGGSYTGLRIETGGETELQWLLKEEEKVELKIEVADYLEAPVKVGDQAGSVSYLLNGEVIREYPVVAKTTVERIGWLWVAEYIYRLYCL